MNGETGIFRTDLAYENVISSKKVSDSDKIRRYNINGFSFCSLLIDEEGEKSYSKKAGNYITAFPGKMWLWDEKRQSDFADSLASEIKRLAENATGKKTAEDFSVLICGLGNRFVTPDSLGPLVCDRLTVTRHAIGNGGVLENLGCAGISAISPGTLGQTGIEALDIIKGAVSEIFPDTIIVIDALASRSTDRLATTVQLSDAGIRPGSGIGNFRSEINRNTVGVPVICIGVPTVVDAGTLVYDFAGEENITDDVASSIKKGRDFFVSPKEIDVISDEVANIISAAIEKAFGIRQMHISSDGII